MKIILISLLLVFSLDIRAQDLIVTTSGDSLNVVIKNLGDTQVVYVYYINYNDEVRSTIEKKKMQSFQFDFYKKRANGKVNGLKLETINNKKITKDSSTKAASILPIISTENYNSFEIGIYAPYSWRTLSKPAGFPDSYFSQLNSGTGIAFDMSIYSSENNGIAFSYFLFFTNAEMSGYSNSNLNYYKVSDDYQIHFGQINYTYRCFLDDSDTQFRLQIGGGFLRYANQGAVNNNTNELTGIGPSLGLGLFIDYKVLSFGAGLKTGFVSSYSLNGRSITPSNNYQGVNPGLIYLMAGFRFGE